MLLNTIQKIVNNQVVRNQRIQKWGVFVLCFALILPFLFVSISKVSVEDIVITNLFASCSTIITIMFLAWIVHVVEKNKILIDLRSKAIDDLNQIILSFSLLSELLVSKKESEDISLKLKQVVIDLKLWRNRYAHFYKENSKLDNIVVTLEDIHTSKVKSKKLLKLSHKLYSYHHDISSDSSFL